MRHLIIALYVEVVYRRLYYLFYTLKKSLLELLQQVDIKYSEQFICFII